MREMKDSGVEWIGKIPTDWSMIRVKHAFIRKNEKAMQEEPIVLSLARSGVRVRDISNNEGQVAESYFNYNPVAEGDLLLNPMDLYSGANCSISHINGVISPAYINLKSKEGFNPVFYDYYFKVQYWLMAFFSYGKGVSFENRWTLSVETLMNYPLVVPSFEEQRRIANYLNEKCSKIDSFIIKQQKIIEKIKQYRLSVISEMIMDSAYPLISLGKCIDKLEQGWSPSPSEKSRESDWHVLSLAAVKEGRFNKTEIKPFSGDKSRCERLKVNKGDFLLTRSNTRGYVGAVCLVDNVFENTIFSDLIYRIIFNTYFLLPSFALYYFQSAYARQQIERDAHGSSSTMVKITHKDIANWKIYLPPIERQKVIWKKLHTLDIAIMNEMDKRSLEINKLIAYKKSLIYEVVTGKREV